MELINWRAMTPGQRDQLMVEKVLGYSFAQEYRAKIPRYSTSLDAAWLLLQEMVKRYQQDKGDSQFEAFADLMLANSEWDSSSAYSEIYPACEIFAIASKWTPDAICIAMLRAFDYEVLTEEAN